MHFVVNWYIPQNDNQMRIGKMIKFNNSHTAKGILQSVQDIVDGKSTIAQFSHMPVVIMHKDNYDMMVDELEELRPRLKMPFVKMEFYKDGVLQLSIDPKD